MVSRERRFGDGGGGGEKDKQGQEERKQGQEERSVDPAQSTSRITTLRTCVTKNLSLVALLLAQPAFETPTKVRGGDIVTPKRMYTPEVETPSNSRPSVKFSLSSWTSSFKDFEGFPEETTCWKSSPDDNDGCWRGVGKASGICNVS